MIAFADVELTPDTIQRTREHFADIYRACIEEAVSGKVQINDLRSYVAWRETDIASMLAGESDHTFTFLQRAHWLQTGECIPLFAPPKG